MSGYFAALYGELLKMRRSKVPALVALGFSLGPLVMGVFMFILKDPRRARELGMLGQKAQLTVGTADWPTLFGMIGQTVAVGGSLVFAISTAWIFGREFSDRTAKDLLASPTPREAIVAAKFSVVALWVAALSSMAFLLTMGAGHLVGLPGFTWSLVGQSVGMVASVALMTLALMAPVAWIATLGRGYLPPLGFAILMLFMANILAATGWGAWFPWAVPALYSGMAGPRVEHLEAFSVAIVAATGLVGLVGTFAWWRWADQAI